MQAHNGNVIDNTNIEFLTNSLTDSDDDCSHIDDSLECKAEWFNNPNNGNNLQQQQQMAQISTEGISQNDLQQQNINIKNNDLKQCGYCNKFFKQDMIVPNLNDNKSANNEIQCWHCLFWMNYSIPCRHNVDGMFGMTIVDYILKCKDIHEMETCTKNSDSGGCFLCEYNIGLPLTDVKELYKLNGSFTNLDDLEEDKIEMDDSYQPGQITVEI